MVVLFCGRKKTRTTRAMVNTYSQELSRNKKFTKHMKQKDVQIIVTEDWVDIQNAQPPYLIDATVTNVCSLSLFTLVFADERVLFPCLSVPLHAKRVLCERWNGEGGFALLSFALFTLHVSPFFSTTTTTTNTKQNRAQRKKRES